MLPVAAMAAMKAPESAVDPRLKPAAHEFEACLMKEFLEPLQHDALFADEKGDGSGEDSGSALMSFGSAALAKAISERGGFGIAAAILGHFDKKAAAGAHVEPTQGSGRKGQLKF
jgi:Rod binding domain-containing protein